MAEREIKGPGDAPELFTHLDSGRGQAWGWRCWGDLTCVGWVGVGLSSQEAAQQELDRHIRDEHKAVAHD